MKRKLVDRCKFAAVFAIMALGLLSCKDDPNKTGLDILPGSDLANVEQVIEKETNKSFTQNDVLLRTDKLTFNTFGTFNDPQFGKTKADFACQFQLNVFPDFPENTQIDSLVLSFLYKDLYGDTLTTQSLKVYELTEDIFADTTSSAGTGDVIYYQDVDLKSLASVTPIAELDFLPKFRLDSTETDTLVQELRIMMDMSLAEKLYNADSIDLVNNDAFVNFFKGLYVESQDIDNGGGLMGISTISYGSKMTMYYNYLLEDSVYIDSLDYVINSNSARVSRFEHDYSQTDFATNLNSEVVQDSLIYLQTMGGLRTKIEIPFLDTWIDSTSIGINKAELIFQVDTVASDYPNLIVPNQLVLTALTENGEEYFPADFNISTSLYGGRFDDTDNTYRFNITRHLQNIVNKEIGFDGNIITNNGFYLTTAFRENQARRVVLKGATSEKGIRIEVTYTKYN